MLIFLTMLAIGWILGFVGAGGSGFIIAILTMAFGVPIQTAFGTSLSAMVFTTIAGAYSHFREGNILPKIGIVVGLFGMVGAFLGTRIADIIPAHDLKSLTALALVLSAMLLAIRLFVIKGKGKEQMAAEPVEPTTGQAAQPTTGQAAQPTTGQAAQPTAEQTAEPTAEQTAKHTPARGDSMTHAAGARLWLGAPGLGLLTGVLSGTFGIGSTPFIQVGLLTLLGVPLRQAVGTTMLVILPIAVAGGVGYYSIGHLSFRLLGEVVLGTMLGSFIGAKFTNLVPSILLKTAMIVVPVIGAVLLLL